MSRFIRYLENGEWKYASVKQVGDLSKLKTSNKQDLVSAINDLIDGGIIEVIQGDLKSIETIIEGNRYTIDSQGKLIEVLGSTSEDLKKKEAELRERQVEIEQGLDKALKDLVDKADLEYVDGELVKKIDFTVHEKKYNEIKDALLKRVDLELYQEQYARIVEEITKKANDIDVQSIIDSLNQDITNQTIEIDNAKTGIIDLDEKVDTVKTEIVNTIDDVKGNFNKSLSDAKSELNSTINGVKSSVDTLDSKIDSQSESFNQKMDDVRAEASGRIESTKQELEGSISSVVDDVTDLNADLESTKGSLTDTKKSLGKTQTDLDEAKDRLQSTKDELDSVKNNIVYKVEIVSTNGNVFKNGQFITTLEARVYHGSKDVTDTMDASKFRWTRISMDREDDIAWNTSHAGGSKSINVTKDDVKVRATFNCEMLE